MGITLNLAFFSYCICFILLMLVLAVSVYGKEPEGDKAPKWLYEGETYGLWYSDLATPEQIERYKVYSFIDWGQPVSNLKWVKEFHCLGIPSIAYVSLYKAPNIPLVEDRRKWEGGSPGLEECKKNPFWQAVDLSKHPEWMLITKDGGIRRPFDNPDYPPGWEQVCTNVKGYTEAVLKGVKGIMDMGFDGLFIDNVHPSSCYGPDHGKHNHLHPHKDNKETYKMLLAQVRQVVKSYGADKICALNSGGIHKEYGQYGDALMWESYIFGGSKRRHDWNRIRQAADEWKSYIDSGKAILALSYASNETQEQRRENVFYAYACAKLSGFLWAHDPILDKIRIGMPTGYIQVADGIHYRLYKRGFVAVNPEKAGKKVDIPVGKENSEFLDLCSNEVLQAQDGLLNISVPADSGRVYVLQ